MAIGAGRAAAIAGTAYRDKLDREMLTALCAHGWMRGSTMLSCEPLNATGSRRFFARALWWSGFGIPPAPYGRELTVHYDVSAEDFRRMDEEIFDEIGKKLATAANLAMEELYMKYEGA